jgi:tRNA(Ile)-lysidine synthase
MKQREFEQRAINFFREKKLFSEPGTILVACSGGADSIAMVHLLKRAAGIFSQKIVLAHINHNLREKESKNDEKFVIELAKKLETPIEVMSVKVGNFGGTLEQRARTIRHSALCYLAKKVNANIIAIGHNAGDRAETVLHNLARGSGLTGISAMQPKNDRIIRPILFATRLEILSYLKLLGESFVQDKTNMDLKYSRNRIRHKIIPELEKVFKGASRSIARFASIANDESMFLDRLTKQVFDSCVKVSDEEFIVDTRLLSESDPVLIRRVIRMLLMKKHEAPTLSIVDSVLGNIKSHKRKHFQLGGFDFQLFNEILKISPLRD